MMGMMSKRTEGQQHCCWESLRDYSFVKLKLQPSQTELLFRSVADCFSLDRTAAAGGTFPFEYKQRKRPASWTDADLSG